MSTKSRERQPLLGASKTSPPIINGRRVTPDISSNSDSGHVRSQVASDNRDNWTGKRSFECCHGFVLAKVSFSFFLSFFLSFFFLFLSFFFFLFLSTLLLGSLLSLYLSLLSYPQVPPRAVTSSLARTMHPSSSSPALPAKPPSTPSGGTSSSFSP